MQLVGIHRQSVWQFSIQGLRYLKIEVARVPAVIIELGQIDHPSNIGGNDIAGILISEVWDLIAIDLDTNQPLVTDIRIVNPIISGRSEGHRLIGDIPVWVGLHIRQYHAPA